MFRLIKFPPRVKLPPRIEGLVGRMRRERNSLPKFQLPLLLDLDNALRLIGNLQLALRHPKNTGPTAKTARNIIDVTVAHLRETGYEAHAELAKTIDDLRCDR